MFSSGLSLDDTSIEPFANIDDSHCDFYGVQTKDHHRNQCDNNFRQLEPTEKAALSWEEQQNTLPLFYKMNSYFDNYHLQNDDAHYSIKEFEFFHTSHEDCGTSVQLNRASSVKLVEKQQIPRICQIGINKGSQTVEIEYTITEDVQIETLKRQASGSACELMTDINPDSNKSSVLRSLEINESETALERSLVKEEQALICEQAHLSSWINFEPIDCSLFAVSHFFSSNSDKPSLHLSKSYISKGLIEFLGNLPAHGGGDLHPIVASSLNLIEDAQKSEDNLLAYVLSQHQNYQTGQIVCQKQIQFTTFDGIEARANCIWQVFPVPSNHLQKGILIKQTWVIYDTSSIIAFRKTCIENTTQKPIQQQVDILDENPMDHTALSLSATKFLRKFRYIKKQKKTQRKIVLQQDKYPHKTCKYRTIKSQE